MAKCRMELNVREVLDKIYMNGGMGMLSLFTPVMTTPETSLMQDTRNHFPVSPAAAVSPLPALLRRVLDMLSTTHCESKLKQCTLILILIYIHEILP